MASKPARKPRIPAPAFEASVLETNADQPRAEVEAIAAQPAPTGEAIMDATTTTAQAQTVFADATDRAKTAFTKGQQLFGDMGEFGRGNVEALVESSKIAAKGLEQFGQQAAAYVRTSVEEAQSQARTLASAGSPTEFLRLQGDFARASFDRMIAETSKNAEAMLKLAGEVAQPLSNRFALAADKLKTAA